METLNKTKCARFIAMGTSCFPILGAIKIKRHKYE